MIALKPVTTQKGDNMHARQILLVDALVNLILGVLLLVFPEPVIKVLGVPMAEEIFYPSVLGAVLFGIGLALITECIRGTRGLVGLGLGGAICINLCGGSILGIWLVSGALSIPLRGQIFLWFLVVLLVGLSFAELIAHFKRKPASAAS
jgi:hypothetical protein